MALYGAFLPIPSESLFPLPPKVVHDDLPGAVVCRKERIRFVPDRKRWLLEVRNEGDRPVQVGSHFPFLETNPALVFDRLFSYGLRLDLPAGTAVRFEPGEKKTVSLVEIGGNKILAGGHGIGSGPFDESKRNTVIKDRINELGFGYKKQDVIKEAPVGDMDHEVVSVLVLGDMCWKRVVE